MKTIIVTVLCTLLLQSATATYTVTDKRITIEDYPHVCRDKGKRPARLDAQALAEVARTLRKRSVDTVWIYKFDGASYRDYHLTVEMVRPDAWPKIFKRHIWLKWAPEPAMFRDGHDDNDKIPVIVPTRKRNEENRLYGLCEDDPDAATIRQPARGGYRATQAQLPNSDATVTLRSPRGSGGYRGSGGRQPTPRQPDVSIVPVFNPPPGAPPSAFVNQATGQIMGHGTTIAVPGFTTTPRGGRVAAPTSPRGNQNARRRRTQSQQVLHVRGVSKHGGGNKDSTSSDESGDGRDSSSQDSSDG